MIHIVIGTKAQLIKMAGIMKALDKKGISYNYVDTGQHAGITENLRKQFLIREPDYRFVKNSTNIATNGAGILWMFKVLIVGFLNRKKIFKNDNSGLCLTHGDTVTTLLAAVLGKLSGQKIVHIEAGFRTHRLFRPFPEELIRRITDKMAYINFAFDEDSYTQLIKSKLKSKNYNVRENTLIDCVRIAKNIDNDMCLPKDFILVSIHRYETIHSRRHLEFISDCILELAKEKKIIWGLHEPTRKALERYKLYDKLKSHSNIRLEGLFDYFHFIQAISKAKFIITDGGGPQDESRYLNVPCLLMRTENERPNYRNVFKCNFELDKIRKFLRDVDKYRTSNREKNFSPSGKIMEILTSYGDRAVH